MSRWEKIRISFIIFLIFISVLILAGRALYLQVYNKKFLAQKFKNQTTKYIEIKGKRGKILDKYGEELAISIKGISVWVNPLEIRNKDKNHIIKALSNILDLPKKFIEKRINRKCYFVWIKRKINFNEFEKLKKLNFKGIHFIEEFKRVYPNGKLACHIIGFCNIDGVGIEGIEYYFNKYLTGKSKKIKILKDAKNNIISVFDPDKERNFNGFDVILTIDKKIQTLIEDTLREWIKKYNATKGVIIVMKPDTGEIVGMASYPEFNPNFYWKYPKSFFRNLAISFNYEPGSTFKPIIVSYSIDRNYISPDELFFISKNGYLRFKTIDIHDHKVFKWLTTEGIIVHSSNIGMVKISKYIGKREIFKAVKLFGFGEKTGITLPGEARGIVRDLRNFSSVTHATISFGQGISVTPIQLIRAYASIINGGWLLKPYIVDAVVDNEGHIVKKFKKTVIKRVISEKTSIIMKEFLRKVVINGTGKKANSDLIKIGGKTGTAQIASSTYRGYLKGQYISSFVGFFPYENPEYLMLMLIVKPRKKYYASDVVCPEFKDLALEIAGIKLPPKLKFAKVQSKSFLNNDNITGLTKKEVLKIFLKKGIKNFEFYGEGFAVKKIYDNSSKKEIVYFN